MARERLDRIEDRLRHVLILLANAPVEYTTIPSDQGDFIGHDRFIGVDLRDEAQALLDEWDEEDGRDDASPGADGGAGTEEKGS